MEFSHLEKNICDTVKEWQTKLGVAEESMQLYYPADSLGDLLGIYGEWDLDVTESPDGKEMPDWKLILAEPLRSFQRAVRSRLGDIVVSEGKEQRYCLKIPPQGIRYIHEHWQESVFLRAFLKMMKKPGCSMADIRGVFADFGSDVVEEADPDGDAGRAFYFGSGEPDEYVYCVHMDEFGATYHRFTRYDYKVLKEG